MAGMAEPSAGSTSCPAQPCGTTPAGRCRSAGCWWATWLEAQRGLVPECVRWYVKQAPTFSDALALVRHELWSSATFGSSPADLNPSKISAEVLNRLMVLACRPP